MAERDTGLLAPKTISDKATAFAREMRREEDTNYDETDNKYDAIRHIGGVLALYAQYPDTASDIITGGKEYLDEYLLGGDETSVEMDRHNNEIARKLYQMMPEEQANKLTTEQALRIAKEYVEGWETSPEGKNPMDLPDSMRPQVIYGKTKEPEMSEDEGPLYRKGADGTWELKEQPAKMDAGGLMAADGVDIFDYNLPNENPFIESSSDTSIGEAKEYDKYIPEAPKDFDPETILQEIFPYNIEDYEQKYPAEETPESQYSSEEVNAMDKELDQAFADFENSKGSAADRDAYRKRVQKIYTANPDLFKSQFQDKNTDQLIEMYNELDFSDEEVPFDDEIAEVAKYRATVPFGSEDDDKLGGGAIFDLSIGRKGTVAGKSRRYDDGVSEVFTPGGADKDYRDNILRHEGLHSLTEHESVRELLKVYPNELLVRAYDVLRGVASGNNEWAEEALKFIKKAYRGKYGKSDIKLILSKLMPLLKEKVAEMNAGGLMLAPGGAVAKAVKSVVAPTAVAMGLSTPEEAEAAYIPLKAFKEGTDIAKRKFDEVTKLIDEGIDDSPGGELYQRTGAYRAEDGEIKVDVAELKARDLEMAEAIGKFSQDAEFFIKNKKKTRQEIRSKISDYLPANSPIFENFPELRDVTVVLRRGKKTNNPRTDETNVYGAFYPTSKEMHILFSTEADLDPSNLRDPVKAFNTLVHEFQHHIQDVKGATSNGFNTLQTGVFATKMKDEIPRLRKLIIDEPNNEKAKAQLKQYTDLLKSAKVDIDSFLTGNYADKFKKNIDSYLTSYAIYVRDLGEAEARSSGRKAFLTEADPTRKEMGVFYPATTDDPGTLEAIKIGSEKQLPQEQILVRRYPGERYKEAHLDFVDPDTKQRVPPKLAVAGTTATGLAAATPSEAFVGSLGFEDPTPSASLIGDERLKDISLEQQVLLDQLAPKTKPYDLITSIPGVDIAALLSDLTYEAGEATKMEPGEEQPEAVDEFSAMEKDLAGGLQDDEYNKTEMRQGGGLETEAGKKMEEEGEKKLKLDREKADLNNDGELSSYEKARGEAVQKSMAEMNEGGMMSDPFAPFQVVIGIDKESGNNIPAGSKPEEVRDDIPAMLSEGEYVMPADVVRYHGLKTMEALRCEAKEALGLMAHHDRIAMVDEETKEPIKNERKEIDYDIEEKDKPEVEEAEYEVVEAAKGADIQTTDEEGVEPLPAATYYRYETRWDSTKNRYRRVPIDPLTGEVVTEEAFDPSRGSRYGLPQVLGGQPVQCPEGYEYDEEKGVCMPISTEEQITGPTQQADTSDGGDGFDQGLATTPTGPTSLKDYASYQVADFLGPNRDLVTPEQALDRMTTPTDVELPTGLAALSPIAQVTSRIGRFADAVGAQRAALQREDLIEATAKDIAEGKIDVGRLAQTYDFTFDPDTASFEKSNPTRVSEITDVDGKAVVTGTNYVGASGKVYGDDYFEDDAAIRDIFGEDIPMATPSYKGMGISPSGIPLSLELNYGTPNYSPATTPSFASTYDFGPISPLMGPTQGSLGIQATPSRSFEAPSMVGVDTSPNAAVGPGTSVTNAGLASAINDIQAGNPNVDPSNVSVTGVDSSGNVNIDINGDGKADRRVSQDPATGRTTSYNFNIDRTNDVDTGAIGYTGGITPGDAPITGAGGFSYDIDTVTAGVGIPDTTPTSTTPATTGGDSSGGGGFGEGVSGAGAGGFGGDDDTTVSTGGTDDFDTMTFDDVKDDPDWGGGNDSDSDSGGGCFITTATLQVLGIDSDDNDILNAFRSFRDEYMGGKEGEASEYYEIAPKIVEAIDGNKEEYARIWDAYLEKAYNLIQVADYDSTYAIYKTMVTDLKEKYL